MKPCLLLACGLLSVTTLGGPSYAQDQPQPVTTVVSPSFAVPVLPLTPAPPQVKPEREPTGLADVIRAKFPLAVLYKELGAGWREITYYDTVYYTKGETTWVTGDEYLVAYKFVPRRSTQLDKVEYITSVANGAYKFDPTDRFELTLLRMTELVSQVTRGATGLRSFGTVPRRTALDPNNFSASFNENLSLIYLRKIYDALNAYSTAYLNVMPPMESAFAARQALQPFAENPVIFIQPGTDQPFKANPLFSNRKREHLRYKGRAVLFYEAQLAPDGMRAVLQYNGTVRRIDEKAWKSLLEISELD